MKKPIRMKSGTIMEMKEKTVVLLTDDCDFIEIPRSEAMDLGQRLSFSAETNRKEHHIRKDRWIGLLVAACLFLGCIGVYGHFMTEKGIPYAYITIDINPSIELAVDRHYRVIGWESFNVDGGKVLEKLQIKGKEADTAIKGIVEEALKQGYFKNHEVGTVLLAAVPNEEYDDFKAHKADVDKDLTEFITKEEKSIETAEDSQINVTGKTLAPKIRKVAKAKKISAGREYLIANAVQSGAKDISEEEIKKANITELLVDHGAQVLEKDVFDQYKKDDQLLLNETRKKRPRFKRWKNQDGTYQNRDGSATESFSELEDASPTPSGHGSDLSEEKNNGEENLLPSQPGEVPNGALSEQEKKDRREKRKELLKEKRKQLLEKREKKKLERENLENKDSVDKEDKNQDPKDRKKKAKDLIEKWKKKQSENGMITPTPTTDSMEKDKSSSSIKEEKENKEKKKKVKKPQKPQKPNAQPDEKEPSKS